jgi:hypothetical protein
LESLSVDYPITDLFFQDKWSACFSLGHEAHRVPGLEHVRGLQIRLVGEEASRLAYSAEASARGVIWALDALGLDLDESAGLDWEMGRTEPHDAGSIQAWQEFFHTFGAWLVDARLGRAALDLRIYKEIRSVISAPSDYASWASSGAVLSLEVPRLDGTSLRVSRYLSGQVPSTEQGQALAAEMMHIFHTDPKEAGGLSGTVPVVLAPGSGAVLFHELVGHPLEADHVLAGASPFSDSFVDDPVAPALLTIVDTPDPKLGPGGLERDDEGQTPHEVVLIDSGRIAGLLHDRTTAAIAATQTTGNGRRQDFRHAPGPRMRNLVVKPGEDDASGLLSEIRNGLYVEHWGEGLSDLTAGLFSLSVERGRLIRNGALAEPVRGLRVRGQLRAALAGIEAVGNDFRICEQPLLCSKRGQVQTGVAGPTVRLGPLEVIT